MIYVNDAQIFFFGGEGGDAFVLLPNALHCANSHAIYEMLSLLESNDAVCLGVACYTMRTLFFFSASVLCGGWWWVCLWIQKDKRSAGTLLPTCRLEDESFISETLCTRTFRSCKNLLKKENIVLK